MRRVTETIGWLFLAAVALLVVHYTLKLGPDGPTFEVIKNVVA